jgi:hypothetical protein
MQADRSCQGAERIVQVQGKMQHAQIPDGAVGWAGAGLRPGGVVGESHQFDAKDRAFLDAGSVTVAVPADG